MGTMVGDDVVVMTVGAAVVGSCRGSRLVGVQIIALWDGAPTQP